MNREFVCIICPNSCQLKVEYEREKVIDIKGAQCAKGEDFVRNEITNPLRVFINSVLIEWEIFLVGVKIPVLIPQNI